MVRRVLMTTDAVGGVWTYALDLAHAFSERGIAVMLATMGPRPSSDQRDEASRIAGLELVESDYKLEWQDDPWDDVEAAGEWLLGLEDEFAPDVVHLNGYCHACLPWVAPKVVVCHSCVLSWWQAVLHRDAPAAWRWYAASVRDGLQCADLVVAPSNAMLRATDRLYGPLSRKHVIPNGRRDGLFGPANKAPFILAAGRLWDEAKNIGALECIAYQLPWPVLIAGDRGPSASTRNVHYLGRLCTAQMSDHLSRASIYCLPARYEPFGLSVLEAAMSGCALVLGDIPSLRENWDRAARFVPPEDTDALRLAVAELADDSVQRETLAEAALERSSQFRLEGIAKEYLSAYDELSVASHQLLRSAS